MTDFSWNNDNVALLKKLWAEGLSASQIQGRLPGHPSRNAVIGKVHRLGLSGRATTSRIQNAARMKTARNSKPKHKPAPDYRAPRATIDVTPVEPLPPDTIVVPVEQRKTLQGLTETCCRWPYGDPREADFYFCGGKRFTALNPYCEHHASRAVQPKSTRRPAVPAEPREYVLVEA